MIRVEGLTKKFKEFTAVDNVSFSVSRGEVFAMLGPNGSGKTTTLKCIAGLIFPTAGNITVDGIDISKDSIIVKRKFSYLPQRIVFPEQMSGREIARFFARLRDIAPEVAEAALIEAGLEESLKKPVGQFSGGMVQRLGMALVAMADAPLLLLDEPTANLDPIGVKRFREFILQQKQAGKTIIFSTHLLNEAEQLADRVGIYVAGKLAAVETPDILINTPRGDNALENAYIHYVERHIYEQN